MSDRTPPPDLAADRLTELEIALAHAERMAEELSDIAREQADRISRLERQLAALAARTDALEDGASAPPPADRPPPHW